MEMNTIELFDILIKISVILLLIFVITLISTIKRKINYDINYKEYNREMGTLEECDNMLDEFITHEFETYCILKLNYKDIEIVNDTMENEILNDMISIVQKRMSNNILTKLLCFYDSESVSDVVAEKILILVTSYRLSINTSKSKEEEIIEYKNHKKNNRR